MWLSILRIASRLDGAPSPTDTACLVQTDPEESAMTTIAIAPASVRAH
jgi:hypothetical protein